jgi:RES domain-containing protein
LIQAEYAAHAFDGEGARLYGGRWNSPGRPVVYTAGSLALAALEVLVHLKSRLTLSRYMKSWIELSGLLPKAVQAHHPDLSGGLSAKIPAAGFCCQGGIE